MRIGKHLMCLSFCVQLKQSPLLSFSRDLVHLRLMAWSVFGLWNTCFNVAPVRTAHCEQSREAKVSALQVQLGSARQITHLLSTFRGHLRDRLWKISSSYFYVPPRHGQLKVQLAPKGLPHVAFRTHMARIHHPGLRRLPQPTQYRQYISAVNFWLS